MRPFFIFMLSTSLLLSGELSSQSLILPLWEDEIPNFRESSLVEKWDSSEIIRISNVTRPDMRVYPANRRFATGQAVVVCPGGGYGILAYDLEGTDMAKWLNSKGITAIVLKYRLPSPESNITPYEAPLMDVQRAIRLTRSHADEWNVDRDKIGVMGFSAGGHLASTAGVRYDSGNSEAADPVDRISCRPDFMILVYPVINKTSYLLRDYATPELVQFYSNDLHVTEDTPPAFLVHCSDDKTVPVKNSIDFYNAMKAKEIPAELHIFDKGGHGFGLALDKPALKIWTELCTNWLKTIDESFNKL